MPSLKSVLQFVCANQLMINVEIKPTTGREYETGAAVAMDVAQQWQGDVLPLLSSFSEAALAGAKAAAPHLPSALLVEQQLPVDWFARLQTLGCVALDADHRLLTQDIVQTAKAHGFRVLCYTVNDPERASLLREWGVDSIITDAVNEIQPL